MTIGLDLMRLGTSVRKSISKLTCGFIIPITFSLPYASAEDFPVFTDGSSGGAQLIEDLSHLSQQSFPIDGLFDMRSWGFDAKNGAEMSKWIINNVGFVLAYRQGPSVCYEGQITAGGGSSLRQIGDSRVDSCSEPMLSVNHGYADYDVEADPKGFLYVVKGAYSLSLNGYDRGGYVITPQKYLPFTEPDAGVFAYRNLPTPLELSSEDSKFRYRIANYLGDSLMKSRQTLASCDGLTGESSYSCDMSHDGVYALKGVALIALSRSCVNCSVSERAFLAGTGIDYLLSTPYGSRWSLAGSVLLRKVGPELSAGGVDVSKLRKKLLIGMVKAG